MNGSVWSDLRKGDVVVADGNEAVALVLGVGRMTEHHDYFGTSVAFVLDVLWMDDDTVCLNAWEVPEHMRLVDCGWDVLC